MNPNYDELDKIDNIDDDVNDIPINTEPSCVAEEQKEILGSPLPSQNIIIKTTLKNTIMKYKLIFGKYLEVFNDRLDASSLDSMTVDELNILLDEIRVSVGCRGSANLIKSGYNNAAGILENIAPAVNMNLRGLQAAVTGNEMLQETLDEISLEYSELSYVPPLYRLMYQSAYIVLALNQVNKDNEKIRLFNDSLIPQNIINEFQDL